MKTNNDLKKEIINSNGLGEELSDKNEFNYLTKYINDDELLDSCIVCLIDGEICLLAFTNRRMFIVKKESIIPSTVKRFGLEEIKDIELKNMDSDPYLLISFYDKDDLKVEGISLEKAQKFGKQIINRIKEWNSSFNIEK